MNFDFSRRLARSRTDRMIAGVAGGMAAYLDIDPTIVRVLWALALLPGGVPGVLLYVLFWLVMPAADTDRATTQHF